MSAIISGDWLMTDDDVDHDIDHDYRVGYVAEVTGSFSYGVAALVTRAVLEFIVAENVTRYGDTEGIDQLHWNGDVVEHTSPVDPTFRATLAPNEQGLYPVPAWAWGEVEAHECARIIGGANVKADVIVPGHLIAHYVDGVIERWEFSPHASDAGYFGPSAILFDYEDDEGDDGAGLDIEDADGPFWHAVQQSLADRDKFAEFLVDWTE